MIKFEEIGFVDGSIATLSIESKIDKTYSGKGLLAMPAVIDPHVHFRTPGMEYKEDWVSGAKAAIQGGCGMVFDMPNTLPPTITHDLLYEKINLINQQLQQAAIPLSYRLFFGADKNHLDEIALVKDKIVGIKVFMGCSTGNLVIDDDESLAKVFALASEHNLVVAVHAEDEHKIRSKKDTYQGEMYYALHSKLRDIDVAVIAVEKAINLAQQYGTKLYILHVSSAEEITLIRDAKARGIQVYAETTPHHLFFNTDVYQKLQGKAVVNPPLRDAEHQPALFQAIHEGVIDTIGSDHAPHTLEEKSKPYGICPSGMPGIEFMLPLLLNAYHEGKISLQEIVALTSVNASKIFSIQQNDNWVIIDLQRTLEIKQTFSRCQWTPYLGLRLTGWPIYTILNGSCFVLDR